MRLKVALLLSMFYVCTSWADTQLHRDKIIDEFYISNDHKGQFRFSIVGEDRYYKVEESRHGSARYDKLFDMVMKAHVEQIPCKFFHDDVTGVEYLFLGKQR